MASSSIVGIEIVEQAVRGVELVKPNSTSPTVRAFAEVELPAGAAKDSEVIDPDAVGVALRELWRKGGFKSKKVVLGVGNRRILVRDYVAPALPLDQIKQALKFQVQDLLPVPVDQAVLDFYPLGDAAMPDGAAGVAGLLVCAVDENIHELMTAMTDAKLQVVGVDLAPFGLARAAARVANAQESTLVVHIGEGTSYFLVLHAGIPRFVRIVPAGINSTETPESTEMPPGFSGGADSADSVDDFVTWFTGTRDYYNRAHPEHPIERVLLSGVGAARTGVPARIKEIAGVEVMPATLSQGFPVNGPTLSKRDELAGFAAAGFAIGGA